ncbi:DUF4913 domain-containing protein [uncultured Gordonia sp.]|uniref:DUF4913 domain-containing protein n=1 Tax=uncultured Gordonia sp. TaxID=198437 RepID=UPI002589D549|nr:DUF4913 domain-containing protein [uncultured Gordonia sp.]
MSDDPAALLAQLEGLRRQVRTLTEHLGRHDLALDALEEGLTSAAPADPAAGLQPPQQPADTTPTADTSSAAATAPDDGRMPDLSVLREWVDRNVSQWCERQISIVTGRPGVRWCAQWDQHPEAITRLWVCRAVQLEAVTEGPAAVSVYLRDHFDHHLSVLTSATGPFHCCTPDKHELPRSGQPRFLPTDPTRLRAVG